MDFKEQEPFIHNDEEKFSIDQELDFDEERHITSPIPKSLSPEHSHHCRRLITKVLIHAGIFLAYCIVTYAITSRNRCAEDEQAFAGLAVKHQFQLYDKFNESPFAGPPSTESDEAWHNLMLNMSIRVSKEELDVHGQTSVELPGGGYLAWLGVFHELHCVKMLRQWSYREHYHPNMTAHDRQHLEVHIDHCIDWLRNAAMCHADTSALAVFKWDKGERPMLNTHRVPHKCVNWDTMMGSHRDRLVSHDEVSRMVNPKLIEAQTRKVK